ncbi:MAG: hypothetical protein HYZ28_23190 [Myxococcales bacterium]|nr:hypothetical protein [Myxococcales bacterium]
MWRISAALAVAVAALPAFSQELPDLSRVRGIPPPLGRIDDVLRPPPEGGLPADERVAVGRLAGCEEPQALFLTRFVSGAALAASQIQAWLESKGPDAPLGLERRLFGGRPRLAEAVRRAQSGVPTEEVPCPPLPLLDGWKLRAKRAPARLCRGERAGPGGIHAFVEQGGTGSSRPKLSTLPASRSLSPRPFEGGARPGRKAVSVTALVHLSPAPLGRAERCRPRLSAVLFDEGGHARLRYHADYGAALSVELLGDGRLTVELTFDEASAVFKPSASEIRVKRSN